MICKGIQSRVSEPIRNLPFDKGFFFVHLFAILLILTGDPAAYKANISFLFICGF